MLQETSRDRLNEIFKIKSTSLSRDQTLKTKTRLRRSTLKTKPYQNMPQDHQDQVIQDHAYVPIMTSQLCTALRANKMMLYTQTMH